MMIPKIPNNEMVNKNSAIASSLSNLPALSFDCMDKIEKMEDIVSNRAITQVNSSIRLFSA